MAKRYYWLKLKEDFFRQPKIKKLRCIAGGDTYTIIYLKMQLLSLKDEGRLFFEGTEDNFADEIALTIDESPENVGVTIAYLMRQGLLEQCSEDEYSLPQALESIGSETDAAGRMRRKRSKDQHLLCDNNAEQNRNNVTQERNIVCDSYTEKRRGEEKRNREDVEKEPEKKAESEAREDPGCETKFGNVLIAAASPDNPDTWPDPESPAPYSEPFYTDKAEANPHPEEPDNRTKRLYGQNKDVELTDRELAALDYYFPGYGLVYADKLSRYMKQTGKWWSRVKHYQLIRKWILSDKEKGALPVLTENQQEEKSNELQSSARNGEQHNFSSWI